jgi:iron(III) transport system substrate-binding protein
MAGDGRALAVYRAALFADNHGNGKEHMRIHRRGICLLAAMIAIAAAPAASRAADAALVAAAKREGEVVWYSVQVVDQLVAPMAAAFEKKYGIKVNYVRTDPASIALRVVNEAKAGKVQVDLFEGAQAAELKKQGLVAHWQPDIVKILPPEFVDPEGYWVATNNYVLMAAYNTQLVPKGQEPRSWDDLLDPKWRGKMVWNTNLTTSAASGFIALVLHEWGEQKGIDYLRKLAKQNIAGMKATARQVFAQVVAGEYAIGLNMYPSQVAGAQAKGAPVARSALKPISLGAVLVASLAKDAPHPNAGKLLFDFLLSDEGQKIYADHEYAPVNPHVAPKDPTVRADGVHLRAFFMNPEGEDTLLPHGMTIMQQLFQ